MGFTAEFLKVSLGQCPDDIQQQLNAQRYHALVAFQYGAMVEAAYLCKLTTDQTVACYHEILKMVDGISEGKVFDISKRVGELHARNYPPIEIGAKAFTKYWDASTEQAEALAAQELWGVLEHLN
jgi:hypothetical protein